MLVSSCLPQRNLRADMLDGCPDLCATNDEEEGLVEPPRRYIMQTVDLHCSLHCRRHVDFRGRSPVSITREAILNTAMQIVDDDGIDALTMRRLGHDLGVDPMMIYRIFPTKRRCLTA